ncbi:hypothetical protein CRI94_07875 [Longibacter salinarum]|uniref:DUF192 domain-containing protein n=1 Tax=Longibacter salinarum TaxID=1850348 RepID=A0A2A8CZ32_9BACT|nr:DUF192 domain-containing protein [Longibacter salinarum]PEN13962.1 hypothetical protein CRI94_07875 [Longibacter salinarum]
MSRLPFLLGIALILWIPVAGCGTDSGKDADSSSADATNIPFDKEGTLAVMTEGTADTVVTIDIEIAESDSAQTRGMMQRESFPDETSGMLFPFADEQPRYFHMSNTPIALDIIFIDADSTIVSISKYTRPYSDELIESGVPAQYVLETPAGFSDTYGLVAGDRVRWTRTDDA